jgi:hypothetical protein
MNLKEENKKMIFKKSPGGSIFPYSYKNGELFGLRFGSFGRDEESLLSRMKAEETFFLQQDRSMVLWMDFYQTKISGKVLDGLIEFLGHTRHLIPKLAVVGCSLKDRRKINHRMREVEDLSTLVVRYYNDPEAAKTWLISE